MADKKNGNGMAIASFVISIIALALSVIDLLFCVQSYLITQGNESVGEAIGAVFGVMVLTILFFIIAIVGIILFIISLSLGLSSMSKNKSLTVKPIAISGVVISCVSILIVVVCFIIRYVVPNSAA